MRALTSRNLNRLALACALLFACAAFGESPETLLLAANQAAMNKMMADMSIKPSGDVDSDFAAMMIPHHQGAIEMALAELRYGHNEPLRRIAQEIIIEQQQEIEAMHVALAQLAPASSPPSR